MRVLPVIGAVACGGYTENSPVSSNELINHAKGPLSEAALFAIVAKDTKLRMVEPR